MDDFREMRRIAGWTQLKTANASGINRVRLSQAECREIELSKQEREAVCRVLLAAIRDRATRIDRVLENVRVTEGNPAKAGV